MGHLESEVKIYKAEHDSLNKAYDGFIDSLKKTVKQQETDLKSLGDQFREKDTQITQMNAELKEKALQVNDLHREVDKENAKNINKKLTEILQTLIEIEKHRREAQNSLEDACKGWSTKLQLFSHEAARKSREAFRQKAREELEELLSKLRANAENLAELEQQREQLEAKIFVDESLGKANAGLRKELESTNLKIRWANDEKKQIFTDLEAALKILEDKNKFIDAQKADIEALTKEIEDARALLEEKKQEEADLRAQIAECDREIEQLTKEIVELDAQIEKLEGDVAEKQRELAELQAILDAKQDHVNALEKELGLAASSKYKAKKGDQVDMMLADFLAITDCPIPIQRIGNGFYMFGSKKIYAKIMNGKLVIRVGGGYMIIDKFIETYA